MCFKTSADSQDIFENMESYKAKFHTYFDKRSELRTIYRWRYEWKKGQTSEDEAMYWKCSA
jgi:hypothetical protein